MEKLTIAYEIYTLITMKGDRITFEEFKRVYITDGINGLVAVCHNYRDIEIIMK